MKFYRLGGHGEELPVVEDDSGNFWSLESIASDIDSAFLGGQGIERTRQALKQGTLRSIDRAAFTRIGAPITQPGSIICIGQNYAAHARESGGTPPETPILFFKAANTIAGPNDPVTLPKNSLKTDWEVELGIVIGKEASYLNSPEESKNHIAGFVTVDDLSERTFQIEESGGQWSKGKSARGFCPVGPFLVPVDEVDHQNLGLRSFVNGEPRQDSRSSDMIFDVDYLVYHLSQYMVLSPGDLVLTGTPEGVALSGRFPYLKAGDVVEIEIEGLGRQRHEFRTFEEIL